TCLFGPATRPHGEDLAELGLLLGRVRDHDAADGDLFGLVGADHDAIFEGLEVHPASVSTLQCRVLTLPRPSQLFKRAGSGWAERSHPARPARPSAAATTRRRPPWRRCRCTWRGWEGRCGCPSPGLVRPCGPEAGHWPPLPHPGTACRRR